MLPNCYLRNSRLIPFCGTNSRSRILNLARSCFSRARRNLRLLKPKRTAAMASHAASSTARISPNVTGIVIATALSPMLAGALCHRPTCPATPTISGADVFTALTDAFRLARQAGRTIEEAHAEASELAGRIAALAGKPAPLRNGFCPEAR